MNAPVLFISHGSPLTVATEDDYAEALRAFGRGLGKPAAVVVVSAHGMTRLGRIEVTAGERPPLIYDFGGFPRELYEYRYPCPGAPALAAKIGGLLRDAGVAVTLNAEGGLDHGVWVPLARLFPGADVPVIQVSMPYPAPPTAVYELGRTLGPLREEGVVLIGSGGAVHNLGALNWHSRGKSAASWARAFNDWVKEKTESRDADALLEFETRAPEARQAHPTPDHFHPLFFTLGASTARDKHVPIVDEFQFETLSMYSFAYR